VVADPAEAGGISQAVGVGFHLLVERYPDTIMIAPLGRSRTFVELSQQAICRQSKHLDTVLT
jgi:hypothetical protein